MMGGNALKNVETRRYHCAEYFPLACEVQETLKKNPRIERAWLIEAYRSKQSFGDADILYSTFDNKPLDVPEIDALFDPGETVRNTNVISFNVEQLQVDAIHAKSEHFEYAEQYFRYNDLGNLIGRIAHKFGLKHGQHGLLLPLRENDQVFAEIEITLDYDAALAWLGFDVDRYHEGFDTLEEIFDFVSTNPFYNPDFYKLENLNSIGRVRDRKRSTYNAFLEYGEKITKQCWVPIADKIYYLEDLFSYFPQALPKYNEAIKELALNRCAKEKFNGSIVSELTKLQDKELGMFMKHLRQSFWLTPAAVVHQTQEHITDVILNEFFIYNHLTTKD